MGKLVCPRICFSLDLLTWIVECYDFRTGTIRDTQGKEIFKLGGAIEKVFKLEGPTELFKLEIIRTRMNLLQAQSFDKFFKNRSLNTRSYPYSKYLLRT